MKKFVLFILAVGACVFALAAASAPSRADNSPAPSAPGASTDPSLGAPATDLGLPPDVPRVITITVDTADPTTPRGHKKGSVSPDSSLAVETWTCPVNADMISYSGGIAAADGSVGQCIHINDGSPDFMDLIAIRACVEQWTVTPYSNGWNQVSCNPSGSTYKTAVDQGFIYAARAGWTCTVGAQYRTHIYGQAIKDGVAGAAEEVSYPNYCPPK